MSAKEFLDEIMRRVELNWGENASEGPYAKQEIVEGVREILAEFKADIDAVIDRAVELVSEQVQAEAVAAMGRAFDEADRELDGLRRTIESGEDYGLLAALGGERPVLNRKCRCSLVPLTMEGAQVAPYDMVLPEPPELPPWKPLRDVIPPSTTQGRSPR